MIVRCVILSAAKDLGNIRMANSYIIHYTLYITHHSSSGFSSSSMMVTVVSPFFKAFKTFF